MRMRPSGFFYGPKAKKAGSVNRQGLSSRLPECDFSPEIVIFAKTFICIPL